MSAGRVILRLAHREYLPLAGWIVGWALVALFVGHADAVRLLAATMLVRAARTLTALDTRPAIRRRYGASPETLRQSLRAAAGFEALSLLAGVVVLAALVAIVDAAGQRTTAWMTLLVGVGLPARYVALAGSERLRGGVFRLALSWCGVALVLAAQMLDLGVAGIALALGCREWLALFAAVALRPLARKTRQPLDTPLVFAEVAAITGARARHRLTYRLGKGLLSAVLGPFGGIVARTGRGVGAHRRLQRFAPSSPAPVVLIACATAGAAGLLLAIGKPLSVAIAASLLRIAAAAGSVLLWWRYGAAAEDHEAGDDPDDAFADQTPATARTRA